MQDLNRVLKQHKQNGIMMEKKKGKGMNRMMKTMSGPSSLNCGVVLPGGYNKFPF